MTVRDDIVTVEKFFAGWDGPDPRGCFEEYLAEDCVWHNTGMPTLEGRAACMQLIGSVLEHFPKVRIDITQLAANDDVVFVQRTDHCLTPDGAVGAVIEVAGVLALRDGKIVRWHDYFDPSPFTGLTA